MWNRPDTYLARHDTHKKAVPCDICSMEEAEMLFSPAVGRDAMVIEVVPVAYRPFSYTHIKLTKNNIV